MSNSAGPMGWISVIGRVHRLDQAHGPPLPPTHAHLPAWSSACGTYRASPGWQLQWERQPRIQPQHGGQWGSTRSWIMGLQGLDPAYGSYGRHPPKCTIVLSSETPQSILPWSYLNTFKIPLDTWGICAPIPDQAQGHCSAMCLGLAEAQTVGTAALPCWSTGHALQTRDSSRAMLVLGCSKLCSLKSMSWSTKRGPSILLHGSPRHSPESTQTNPWLPQLSGHHHHHEPTTGDRRFHATQLVGLPSNSPCLFPPALSRISMQPSLNPAANTCPVVLHTPNFNGGSHSCSSHPKVPAPWESRGPNDTAPQAVHATPLTLAWNWQVMKGEEKKKSNLQILHFDITIQTFLPLGSTACFRDQLTGTPSWWPTHITLAMHVTPPASSLSSSQITCA